MKNHLLTLFFGIMVCASASSTAFAVTQAASKMTCEDFIALDEISRPKAIYWANGYNWYGQPNDAYYDFAMQDQMVPIVVEECTKNPKHLFVKKVKAAGKKVKS